MTRSIGDLMGKYQALEPSDRKIKRAVRKALLSVCEVELPESHIKVQQKTVFLTMHPIEKRDILQKKDRIVQEVTVLLGLPAITDFK